MSLPERKGAIRYSILTGMVSDPIRIIRQGDYNPSKPTHLVKVKRAPAGKNIPEQLWERGSVAFNASLSTQVVPYATHKRAFLEAIELSLQRRRDAKVRAVRHLTDKSETSWYSFLKKEEEEQEAKQTRAMERSRSKAIVIKLK